MRQHSNNWGAWLILFLCLAGTNPVWGQVTWYDRGVEADDNNRKVEYFTKALELERQDNWVYYFRGWAYYSLERYEKAMRDFQTGLTVKGTLDASFLNSSLAWCSYRLEKYDQGLEYAQKSVATRDDNTEGWNALGWCDVMLDKPADAVTAFTKFIALKPNVAMGYSNRSYAYVLTKEYDKVIADCDKALSFDPKNEYLLERKAYSLIKMGKNQEGIDLIKSKIDYKPDDPLSLSNIGNLFFRNEDYTTAIDYHTRGMKLYADLMKEDREYMDKHRKDIYEIYMSRGGAYYAMKDYQRALGDYKHATTILPNEYRAWHEIGQLQTFQKNWSEGAQAYEKAFALRPDLKFGWVNLGFCYDNLNQPYRAIDAYTRGIKNNPDVGLLYNNRGYGYLELKEYDKAYADLQKAIDVEPDIVMSHVSLGEYFYDRKMYDDAIAKFNQAVKMEDGTFEAYTAAYFTRGLCYYDQEKYEMAINDFLEAIKHTPKHVLAHEKAGITYFKLNKLCEAYTYLKRTLDLESTVANKQALEAPKYMGKMTKNPCVK
ncbi:MAG: tetratricopeptide repeat protein [Bacteroidia bacterium]